MWVSQGWSSGAVRWSVLGASADDQWSRGVLGCCSAPVVRIFTGDVDSCNPRGADEPVPCCRPARVIVAADALGNVCATPWCLKRTVTTPFTLGRLCRYPGPVVDVAAFARVLTATVSCQCCAASRGRPPATTTGVAALSLDGSVSALRVDGQAATVFVGDVAALSVAAGDRAYALLGCGDVVLGIRDIANAVVVAVNAAPALDGVGGGGGGGGGDGAAADVMKGGSSSSGNAQMPLSDAALQDSTRVTGMLLEHINSARVDRYAAALLALVGRLC